MAEEIAIVPSAAPSREKWCSVVARFGFPLVVIVAIFATYWPSLHNQFVKLDDHVTVYQNPRLIRLSGESLASFWREPQLELYAPLTYTLFAGIASISRTPPVAGHPPLYPFDPMAFHVADLGLHVLAALVVYALLRRLVGGRFPAVAGALLFGLHPVQVESVSWVTETSNLLSSLFGLLAVYFYVRSLPLNGEDAIAMDARSIRARRAWFFLATEVYLLALFSKPLGVIVPALALVIHWMLRGPKEVVNFAGSSEQPRERSKALSPMTPRTLDYARPTTGGPRSIALPPWLAIPWQLAVWLIMAVPFAWIARRAQPVPNYLHTALWMRPLIAGDAISFYCYKILYPSLLLADYDRSPRVILNYGWIYYTWIFAAIIGLGIAWFWKHWRARAVVAGAAWFVVALLPVLGLTPFVYQAISTVADRYLYLPMFGVALCAAWMLAHWQKFLAGMKPMLVRNGLSAGTLLLTMGLLAALGIRTSEQTRYWHDSDALFAHTKKYIGREPGAQENAPTPDSMPLRLHRRPI